jgi:MFS family permease
MQASPSRAYANYVLLLLTASFVVNYLDRYLLSMLAAPIQAELGVTDAQIGFLLGPAFALLYTLLGVPVAWLADRHPRRELIALGIAIWSACTALTGLARSPAQIALGRFGLGVGQAAGAAPAHSLIADYFPPERRATALAIFQTGVPIGMMLGTLIGGVLVAPLGWRGVFVWVGLPGIAVALLVRLTVREPARALPPGGGRGLAGVLREFASAIVQLLAIPTFRAIAFGGMLAATAGTAFGFWLPTMFVRSHGMSLAKFGMTYGIVSGLAGIAGTTLAGVLADRLARVDPRWRLRVAAASVGLSIPLLVAICTVPDPTVAMWLSVPSGIVGAGYAPVLFAIAQSLAPARLRAMCSAVLILFITGAGMLIGPWAVGALSDVLEARFGEDSLRAALVALIATMSLGVLALLRATRTLLDDLASPRA